MAPDLKEVTTVICFQSKSQQGEKWVLRSHAPSKKIIIKSYGTELHRRDVFHMIKELRFRIILI